MALRDAVLSLPSRLTLPAWTVLPTVSFLNFLRVIAPVGSARLRSGWNIVNKWGIMDKLGAGVYQADGRTTVSAEFRNDTWWWRQGLESCPV